MLVIVSTSIAPGAKRGLQAVAGMSLAMRILAGPGTIATAMRFSAGGELRNVGITIFAFAVLCVINYVIFVFGAKFVTYIVDNALGAITRMMALILAVIGTQMVIAGLHGAFAILY